MPREELWSPPLRKWARDSRLHGMPVSLSTGGGAANVRRLADDGNLRILDSPSGQFGNTPRTVDYPGNFASKPIVSVPTTISFPPWVPLIGTTAPMVYADFTSEGTTNHYWNNGTTYGSAAAWVTGISATFARASTGYSINSSGNLVSAGNNVLRFDYDPVALTSNGILLEGASTNVIIQSNTFSDASWTKSLITVSQDGTLGPDNATQAYKATEGSAGSINPQLFQNPTVTNGATYTESIYVKKGNLTWCYMQSQDGGINKFAWFNLATGAIGTVQAGITAAISGPVNGYYRLSITRTTTATSLFLIFGLTNADNVAGYAASGTGFHYVSFSQMENLNFASSYIPTTNATVTRAADNFNVPWTATTFTALVATKQTAEQDTNKVIDAGNGLLTQQAGPNVQTNNGTQTLATSVNAWTASNIIGVTGTPTSRALSANGNTSVTDANALVPSAPTKVQIGADTADANNSFGDFAQFGLWNVAATAAQLQTLT